MKTALRTITTATTILVAAVLFPVLARANVAGDGTLGNFVWNDLNANGIQDPGEPGIEGVTVRLFSEWGHPSTGWDPSIPETAVTDANGYYLFTGLYADTRYQVEVDMNSPNLAGFTATTSNVGSDSEIDSNPAATPVTLGWNPAWDYDLNPNVPTILSNLTIDFGFIAPPTGRIGDRVWVDENQNGVQDYLDTGISGITVVLKAASTGNVLSTTSTDANGYYLFSGLSAGAYLVEVNESGLLAAGFSPTTSPVGSDTAIDSNGSPAEVTLATNGSQDLTIDFGYYVPVTTSHGTFTQGGWGAKPSGNNPGALLAANFNAVYPTGVIIGGGYTLTFTSAAAIEKFLPQGGTAAPLTKSELNPSKKINVLAGQTLALKLNVDFSAMGLTGGGIGGLKVASGKLAGYSVNQVLALCNAALGGNVAALPYGVTVSNLNDVATAINENYGDGTSDNGFLQ